MAALAYGNSKLTPNVLFKAGAGLSRLDTGNAWDTAPIARLGVSYVTTGASLDVNFTHFSPDDADSFNAITAGLTSYF